MSLELREGRFASPGADYIDPARIVAEAVQAAEKKSGLSLRDLLIRGALSGALLGYATSVVMVILAQGLPGFVGALAFPVGFVILVLLGLELVTGNFALLPQGVIAGRVSGTALARNWIWVYVGNLLGSLLYATLFWAVVTGFGASDGGAVAEQVRHLAEKKTMGYSVEGVSGWGTALVSGILCNWMVTVGSVLAFASRSAIGKIAAMWLPITIFFALGYEHAVVNMYVIPAGILLDAPVSVGEWWAWNQIPVTIGNIVGGVVFTGVALFVTFGARRTSDAAPGAAPKGAGEVQGLAGQDPELREDDAAPVGDSDALEVSSGLSPAGRGSVREGGPR